MKLRIVTSVAAAAVIALGFEASGKRRRILDLEAEIARRFPGQPVAHGIDAKGPWARIGETTARGRPGVEAALLAALAKAAVGDP